MGFFDFVGKAIDPFDVLGTKKAAKNAEEYQSQQEAARVNAKATQYNLLGQMKGPEVSDATRRRIAALEKDSMATSLAEDPYFQSDRQTLVQGGQAALSGVQNAQAAENNSGGYSNQGSISDTYDRLGAGLAQLGQQSRILKDQKSSEAASMNQAILENQRAYDNSIIQAKMAIEAGDAAAANQAMAAAFQAKQNINQANRNLIVGAGMAAMGNPAGFGLAAQGAQASQAASSTQFAPTESNTGQGPTIANSLAINPGSYGSTISGYGTPYWKIQK